MSGDKKALPGKNRDSVYLDLHGKLMAKRAKVAVDDIAESNELPAGKLHFVDLDVVALCDFYCGPGSLIGPELRADLEKRKAMTEEEHIAHLDMLNRIVDYSDTMGMMPTSHGNSLYEEAKCLLEELREQTKHSDTLIVTARQLTPNGEE